MDRCIRFISEVWGEALLADRQCFQRPEVGQIDRKSGSRHVFQIEGTLEAKEKIAAYLIPGPRRGLSCRATVMTAGEKTMGERTKYAEIE